MLLFVPGCAEDGPGSTPEESCCACVRDQGCGGTAYDFATCVVDGYHGFQPVAYDLTCVEDRCAAACADNAFHAVAP